MPRTIAENVLVLTYGLSGSSVLTSLIAQAGYWTGDSTFRKKDYDTHENYELVQLNEQIIEASGYEGNYTMEFSAEAVSRIAALHGSLDEAPFKSFIDKCNAHKPWIWKDPRLWLTIRFWKHFLDLDACKFVVLTRDNLQVWISATLRRQIQTFKYNKDYNEGINQSILRFVTENELPFMHLAYEDLILEPAPTIDKLNRLLGTELTVDDLTRVYRKTLYKKPRTTADLFKAGLIYAKNYGQRFR